MDIANAAPLRRPSRPTEGHPPAGVPDAVISDAVEQASEVLLGNFLQALLSGDEQQVGAAADRISDFCNLLGGSDDFVAGPPTTRSTLSAAEGLAPSTSTGPQQLNRVLDGLSVETNPKYRPSGRPGTAGRTTWCNVYTQDALKKLGVPSFPTGNANSMNRWFKVQGPRQGWRQVSAAEAQAMANQGRPTVASWANPKGVHGHIAMVRPGELTDGSPTIAQAGGTNFNKGTVKRGFGAKQPQYFVYQGATQGSSTAPVGATRAGRSDLGGFRSTQYDGIIREMAAKYGVPARLIKCVIEQESKFKPNAGSGKGAKGLMQLMPGTARELGVRNVFDPRQSIEGGTKYLARMLKMFKGDIPKALAGYNAGPGNVIKYRGIPPFRETQTYVRNIVGNYYGGARPS